MKTFLKKIIFAFLPAFFFLIQTNNMMAQTNGAKNYTKEELEWLKKAAVLMMPRDWPGDAVKKRQVLIHCAESLRAAIDTNTFKLSCANLTNSPNIAIELNKFSALAASEFDDFALLLTNNDLKTSIGDGEYSAEIFEPANYLFITF